jgi:hypothetical protein
MKAPSRRTAHGRSDTVRPGAATAAIIVERDDAVDVWNIGVAGPGG